MPEPDAERPAAPAAPGAAEPSPKQGVGCLWLIVVLPVAIVAGIVIGALLSGGDDDGEVAVTVTQGTAGGLEWVVDAERDIQGSSCAFMYLDGELLTGACTTAPQGATLEGGPAPDDRVTVVFGRAPRQATRVSVGLRVPDGPAVDPVEADTVTAEPVEGRYYVVEVPGAFEVTGTLEVLAEE